MNKRPSYEDLELRIKNLQSELLSARKKDEITKDARKNYKRFLKFLPYPVIVRDGRKQVVSYLNPAFTKTFGWTLEELKGSKGTQYVPKFLENELTDRIKDLPAHKNVLELNTRRLAKDGRILDVMVRVGVDKDKDNNPEGMIIVLRDETMDKRRKRNRTAMNRISRALPQYPDLKKLLFYVNTEIKELLGTENANTILLDESKNQFYFLSTAHEDSTMRKRIEKTRFQVDELLAGKVIKTGKPLIVNNFSPDQYFYESRDKKIGYKVKNVLLVPLQTKERIIGILAADNKKSSDFDETDLETLNTIAATVALSIENARVSRQLRQAYEELKNLNHAKDKMISHLSHELKTPVAILLSSFKILSKKLSDLPDKTWQPTIERIQRNLNRIIGIEDEVYDIVERKQVHHYKIFSLILEQCQDEFEALIAQETGEKGVIAKVRQKIEDIFSTQDPVFQQISLNTFVEQRIAAIQPDMSHRDVSLITRLEPCPLIKIPADPLQKTVDGLIRNSVENTPDGKSIEIFVHKKNKGVEFIVKDHGTGLTKKAQKQIFQGFFSTRETMAYSSKRPFDFNAGGKGADLLRMKIFSEKFNFTIFMKSKRCSRIPRTKNICPGSIHECQKDGGHVCDGYTIVTCFFPGL